MKPIHLVLDNVLLQKSAEVLATLRLIDHRVTVKWLPAYCSELNPIDRFWCYLKEQVCVNKIKPRHG
ncbi:MAG: transposase [Anaerolineales bacterium]|nr:transposase [Anaerolineales bacterium]